MMIFFFRSIKSVPAYQRQARPGPPHRGAGHPSLLSQYKQALGLSIKPQPAAGPIDKKSALARMSGQGAGSKKETDSLRYYSDASHVHVPNRDMNV
jgi:hypothetical protein